jgi:hypothetical protein
MQIKSLVLLAAGAAGFIIPPNQPDGVYMVTYDSNSTEIHTPVNIGNRTSFLASSAKWKGVGKREIDPFTIKCEKYDLDPCETDQAVEALDKQCGYGALVKKQHNFYSISGCTVAYYCNLSQGFSACSAIQRRVATEAITQTCGQYKAGWTESILFFDYNYRWGYENVCNQGKDFCLGGTDKPVGVEFD